MILASDDRHNKGVLKQSLGLGQITTKVHNESYKKRGSSKASPETKTFCFHEHYCSDRHNGIKELGYYFDK